MICGGRKHPCLSDYFDSDMEGADRLSEPDIRLWYETATDQVWHGRFYIDLY